MSRRIGWLIALAGLTGLLAILDLATGSARVPPLEVLRILVGGEAARPVWASIVWDFRLPRTLTAGLAGGSLAISGLLMQTLFRNPLAGPYVLGVSSGASLGVAAVVLGAGVAPASLLALGGLGGVGTVLAAAAGAGVSLALVLAVAKRVAVLTLLVLGMLLGYATGALVSVLLHFGIAERVQAYVVWTFGSFAGVGWGELAVLAPVLVLGCGVAGLLAKPLDALLLGAEHARSLGVPIERVRTLLLVATALLAGGVTAFCGPIGFVGVAVPHLARGVTRSGRHVWLLPTTALLGAATALLADLVAQLPGSDAVLPLNAVTALLGAPVVAAVVLRSPVDRSFGS